MEGADRDTEIQGDSKRKSQDTPCHGPSGTGRDVPHASRGLLIHWEDYGQIGNRISRKD